MYEQNEQSKSQVNGSDNKSGVKAKVGFILGLVGIVAWIIPLFGYPVTIVGIVFSCLGLKSSKKKLAVTGLVLSIIFLAATLINSVIGSAVMLKCLSA